MKYFCLFKSIMIVTLLGVSMPGCGNSIFNTEPSADWGEDSNGRRVLLDTERNWENWREGIDRLVRTEAAGMKAPGDPTWEKLWNRELGRIGRSRENSQRYIDYIIEQRRKAGLPELEASQE